MVASLVAWSASEVRGDQPPSAAADGQALENLAGELPRIPPVPPAEVMGTFRVGKGFRIELVAAEPDVVDPIALAFDEDGHGADIGSRRSRYGRYFTHFFVAVLSIGGKNTVVPGTRSRKLSMPFTAATCM